MKTHECGEPISAVVTAESERTPRPAWTRWSRRLALVVIGSYSLYLSAANGFLASGLLEHEIVLHQGAVVLGWRRAWSLVPGRVQVSDFFIRCSNRSSVEFWIHAREAAAVIDLPALLHGTFHADQVVVDGVQMRMRFLAQPVDRAAAEQALPLLPPIVGFADPPLAAYTVEEAPPTEATSTDWAVNLTNIDVRHLDEVWIQQFRWTGEAGATGQFHVRPLLEVGVGPAQVQVSSGTVRLGMDGLAVASATSGVFAATVETFAVQDLGSAGDFLRFVNTGGELHLELPGLEWTDSFLSEVKLSQGAGQLELHPIIQDGIVAPGASVRFDAARIDLAVGESQTAGAMHLVGEVHAGEPSTTNVSVDADDLELRVHGGGEARLVGGRAKLNLRGGPIDLFAPAFDPEAEVRLDGFRAESLRAWTRELGVEALGIEAGSAVVSGSWKMRDREHLGWGHVRLHSEDLKTQLGGQPIAGHALLDVELAHLDLDHRAADVDGSSLELGERGDAGWWGKLEVETGRLVTTEPIRFEGTLDIQGQNSHPLLGVLAAGRSIPSSIVDACSSPGLEGHGRVTIETGSVAAGPFRIASGRSELLGQIRSDQEGVTGAVLLRGGPLAVALDLSSANRAVHVFDAERWWRDTTESRQATKL